MICENHYCRRCRECGYPRGSEQAAAFPLPVLRKKIIYLDQFAISNMMKALNPQTHAFKKGAVDSLWLELFERVDTLCKSQLIICPDSSLHVDESLLSPHFHALKRLYELLSHGATFFSPEEIKRTQLFGHAKNWALGIPEAPLALDARAVIHGNVDAWQERLIISVGQRYDEKVIDELRTRRAKVQEALRPVFDRWRSEQGRTFDDWFQEECAAFADITLQLYRAHLDRLRCMSLGQIELTMNDLFAPPSVLLIESIHHAFRAAGCVEAELWPKTVEYLRSSYLTGIPFLRIHSMMFAAVARKAAAGMKKPLSQGLANDIKMLSALLPYCDAMFIDNECYSYLNEMPLREDVNYGTVLFCLNNRADFSEYLKSIEDNAPSGHFEKVDEVYGPEWRAPYTTLYRE